MQLTELFVHPLKSCRGNALSEALVEPMGLQHDRRWMLAADGGRFLTGREYPRMVLIEATPNDWGITFSAPGMEPLHVTRQEMTDGVPVTVWKSQFDAFAGSDEADFWFSDFMGVNCRLVYIDSRTSRRTSIRPDMPVGFADGYPVLLIGTASLHDLNSRLAQPVSMRHFRTNLVVETTEPYVEDQWHRVRIGDVEFEFTKRCARCIFTTVDPVNGVLDPQRQPLNTLNGYRNTDSGPTFGINLVASQVGVLRLGDKVEVLART